MSVAMQVDEEFAPGLVVGGLEVPLAGTACRYRLPEPEGEGATVTRLHPQQSEAGSGVEDDRGPEFDRAPVPRGAASVVDTPMRPVPRTVRVRPVTPRPQSTLQPGPGSNVEGPGWWSWLVGERREAPVSQAAVVTVGFFALVAAASAFLLSFQMILPVVLAAGWSGITASLGPIVIDVAAVAAAFMSVLSQHHAFERTGRLLLVAATALSIALNLAGHQVKKAGHEVTAIPAGWDWSVNLFSVTVPLILAALIHAFGKALNAYLSQQAEARAAAERQAEAERQQREAEEARAAAEAERQEREQAERQELLAAADEVAAKPRPKRPVEADRKIAVALGIKHRAGKPSELVKVLTAANYKPKSESSTKNWCREIRAALEQQRVPDSVGA